LQHYRTSLDLAKGPQPPAVLSVRIIRRRIQGAYRFPYSHPSRKPFLTSNALNSTFSAKNPLKLVPKELHLLFQQPQSISIFRSNSYKLRSKMKNFFHSRSHLDCCCFCLCCPSLAYTEVAKLISNFLFYSARLTKLTNSQQYTHSWQIMERNVGGLCKYSGGKWNSNS
jgi:hypothetical protein